MKKNNNGKILIETLIKNIRQEISSIDEIYLQIEPLIKTAEKASLEERGFYNRAAGSILHDFYTGLEKIFCEVANKIDSGLPKQEDWHIRLLKSMAQDSNKRLKVISLKSMEELARKKEEQERQKRLKAEQKEKERQQKEELDKLQKQRREEELARQKAEKERAQAEAEAKRQEELARKEQERLEKQKQAELKKQTAGASPSAD